MIFKKESFSLAYQNEIKFTLVSKSSPFSVDDNMAGLIDGSIPRIDLENNLEYFLF